MSRGVLLYTNNVIEPRLFDAVLRRLAAASAGLEAVCVSHQPVAFGCNVVVNLPSGAESILRQIRLGLDHMAADVVYLAEHDVLYDAEHFRTVPAARHHFLYNRHCWQVDCESGQAVFRASKRTSQLVVYRDTLAAYLDQVLAVIDEQGYRPGFGVAPMTHGIASVRRRGIRGFATRVPNIDLRHRDNLSQYVWTAGDILADGVPWWGKTMGRFDAFLAGLRP